MKQIKKNFLFSNFNSDIENRKILKSDLKIESIYNLTAEHGRIEPTLAFTNFFENLIPNESYQTFSSENIELLNKIIYTTIYEYEDENSHEIEKRIFALDSSFYLYELNFTTLKFNSLNISFSEFPTVIKQNGKLYFFLHNETFVLVYGNCNPICLTAMPNLTNFCNCNEKAFFTVKDNSFKIYFTEECEIEDLSDEIENYEYISLNPDGGKVLKLITYKENTFVVQQYRISKIYSNSKEIKLQVICDTKSKIFDKTICQIDDNIVFLSTAGLFVFDGNDIKQVFKNITNNLCRSHFNSISFNNKYYLATKYYINELSEDVLIEFDFENMSCNFSKIGYIENLYSIKSYNFYELLIVIKNENDYKIFRQNQNKLCQIEKYIKFNRISFDDQNTKILNSLKLSSGGQFILNIKSEIDEVSFKVYESCEINNIGLKGQWFEFEIVSEQVFWIDAILIGINFVEE